MFAGLHDAFAVPARSRPDRALSGLGEVRVLHHGHSNSNGDHLEGAAKDEFP